MDIFAAYEQDLRLRGASPHSILAYQRVVKLWTAFLRERGVAVEEARKTDVQAWLLSTGWAPSTMRDVGLAWLRAAYNYALDDLEIVHRNPCRRVRLPKDGEKVVRTVPNRVLREIKADLRDERDALVFALFAYTGCRTIEVRRLTWLDVSLADNLMKVTGKNSKERLVPIHPELRRRLVVFDRGSIYVVPGRAGGMIGTGGLHYVTTRIWGRWGVRNHDLRRTVASSLRANKVDPVVRDALMGWTRGDIFSRHYSAVSQQELQEAILKLYAEDPV
jgi:integrase